MSEWVVPATVIKVIDGDTIQVKLDLGWHISLVQYIRLEGINAPEVRTQAGKNARDYLRALCYPEDQVMVVSKKILGSLEKYGRILARVRNDEGEDYSQIMLDAGMATPTEAK
jgi:micrococcal nuclease